jgi:ubiquinone/menaquinone biosynthesis C-methylase UbiE
MQRRAERAGCGDATLPQMQPDNEVINRWSNSAPFWEKHHEIIRQMFAPITEALIAAAQIGKGNAVLDVATGPGEPALTLADVVGPEGKVFGVDPIPEMVAGARRGAERLGLKNTSFEVAFADQLPFATGTFDAAVSRFGVMFFPSPLDGVREMLRVLKPGRTLAMAVWGLVERNPFHFAMAQVMDRFVTPQPLAPDAPDAFRFARSGKLLEIFSQAGAVAPAERALHFKIEAQISAEKFWTLRCEMSETYRKNIAALSAEQRKEVKRLSLESFHEYATESGLSFPAEVFILTGTKKLST